MVKPQLKCKNLPVPVIFFTILLNALGFGILIPVIPLLLADPSSAYYMLPAGLTLKQGYIIFGFLVAAYSFMQFIATPVLGQFSDKYGRKKILAISLAGTLISYVIFAIGIVIKNIPLLFISRAIDGITGGNISVAQAVVADVTTPQNRSKNFGIIGSAFGIGFIVGPFLGGILSDEKLVSWFNAAMPFWFAAFLSAINVMVVIACLSETFKLQKYKNIIWSQSLRNIVKAFRISNLRVTFIVSALLSVTGAYIVSRIRVENETRTDQSRSPVPAFSGLGRVLLDFRVIAVAASAMAMFLLFSSVRGTMIPLYADNVLHLDSSQIGLIFSITSATIFLVLFFLTDPLERVLGRSKLLSVSLLVCSLAVLVLSLPSGFAAFAIASVPLGVGFGLLQPIPFAMIIDLSEPRNRGLMMGTVRTVADLGIILGPNIVGWLLSVGEPAWVFYLIAVIIGGISILTWAAFRRFEKKEG